MSTHQQQQQQQQQDSKNSDTTQVVQFYKGANVLITGASGFLGKVLLWKILDSCPDVGNIYVLIRSKNNLSAQKRVIQLLKGKPFNFKYQYTDLLQKVVAIESDITEPGMGLSQSDRSLLEERVNIVIHSAASVRFDAPLKDNLRDNVYGTKSIVELCDNMPNIKALVHVSTAYSNCHAPDIEEELIPLEKDIDEACRLIESLSDEACDLITHKLLEGRPNTYTYTKAIAEHYVARHQGNYPITIVRPSIVISSVQEPHPGWIDNVNGITGLGCLAAIGLLRTIDWNYYATSDMVPVDFVANCIICAAYQVHHHSPDKILIFNMTSGNVNPISWGVFFEMLRNTATKTPPNKIVRPMIQSPKYTRANPVKFLAIKYFSELLFAYTVDIILTLIGYKKILVKITQKMHHGYRILKPFTINQWNFKSDNVLSLCDSLSETDKNLFNFDMRRFDWLKQADNVWSGGRMHILKEEATEASYKSGKRRQILVSVIHYGFMALFSAFSMYTGAKILRIC